VCRLRARALTPRPRLTRARKAARAVPRAARLEPRMIWWQGLRRTPVFDGDRLATGNVIRGPAVVETADTTVVVHPGTTLRVDALDNFEITYR
jgi:N-methylhydantoinase A